MLNPHWWGKDSTKTSHSLINREGVQIHTLLWWRWVGGSLHDIWVNITNVHPKKTPQINTHQTEKGFWDKIKLKNHISTGRYLAYKITYLAVSVLLQQAPSTWSIISSQVPLPCWLLASFHCCLMIITQF